MPLLADAHLLKVDNKAMTEPPVYIQNLHSGGGHGLLEVPGNIAQLLPDVTHDFLLTVVVKPRSWGSS